MVLKKRPPPGGKHDLNKSDDSRKGKGKKEKKKDRLRWQHYAIIFIVIVLSLMFLVHLYNVSFRGHYPAKLQTAKCLFDERVPFFVHCKDREPHNKALLQKMVDSVKDDLNAESIADASVTLALSQTMRTGDKKLRTALLDYMMLATNEIRCNKLVDVASIDLQKETLRGICAAAEFRNEGELNNTKALEAFNAHNDVIFLMAIYGSEFHEGTMRYTYEGPLTHNGEPIDAPLFSSAVYNFYFHFTIWTDIQYESLLKRIVKIQNNSDEERLGTSLLAIELRKSLTAMRRCNPPPKITWMEYHLRSTFKRKYYEDIEEDCGWAGVADSFVDQVNNIIYDCNFRTRRVDKKLT